MRRVLIAVLAVGFFVLSLRADEKPTEAYQKAMHDAGDAQRAARSAAKEIEDSGAGAQDYMPFEAATATMKASFATTLAYWQEKKVDDGVALARDAAKLVGELEAAAKDRDYRQVLDAMTALDQTCTACHTAHRVRMADGAFGIK
jgi:cytochrome c556